MVYQTEETRAHILDRAASVFAEQGFFDAQMKDIADAVGMSRHTLYRYFQNKIDLGMAIAEQKMLMLSKAASAHLKTLIADSQTPAIERFKAFLKQKITRELNSEDGRFLAEFDAYFSKHRAPSNFQNSLDNPAFGQAFKLLASLVEQGRQDGSMRTDITQQQLIAVVTGLRAIQNEVLLRGELLLGVTKPAQVPSQLVDIIIAGLANQTS